MSSQPKNGITTQSVDQTDNLIAQEDGSLLDIESHNQLMAFRRQTYGDGSDVSYSDDDWEQDVSSAESSGDTSSDYKYDREEDCLITLSLKGKHLMLDSIAPFFQILVPFNLCQLDVVHDRDPSNTEALLAKIGLLSPRSNIHSDIYTRIIMNLGTNMLDAVSLESGVEIAILDMTHAFEAVLEKNVDTDVIIDAAKLKSYKDSCFKDVDMIIKGESEEVMMKELECYSIAAIKIYDFIFIKMNDVTMTLSAGRPIQAEWQILHVYLAQLRAITSDIEKMIGDLGEPFEPSTVDPAALIDNILSLFVHRHFNEEQSQNMIEMLSMARVNVGDVRSAGTAIPVGTMYEEHPSKNFSNQMMRMRLRQAQRDVDDICDKVHDRIRKCIDHSETDIHLAIDEYRFSLLRHISPHIPEFLDYEPLMHYERVVRNLRYKSSVRYIQGDDSRKIAEVQSALAALAKHIPGLTPEDTHDMEYCMDLTRSYLASEIQPIVDIRKKYAVAYAKQKIGETSALAPLSRNQPIEVTDEKTGDVKKDYKIGAMLEIETIKREILANMGTYIGRPFMKVPGVHSISDIKIEQLYRLSRDKNLVLNLHQLMATTSAYMKGELEERSIPIKDVSHIIMGVTQIAEIRIAKLGQLLGVCESAVSRGIKKALDLKVRTCIFDTLNIIGKFGVDGLKYLMLILEFYGISSVLVIPRNWAAPANKYHVMQTKEFVKSYEHIIDFRVSLLNYDDIAINILGLFPSAMVCSTDNYSDFTDSMSICRAHKTLLFTRGQTCTSRRGKCDLSSIKRKFLRFLVKGPSLVDDTKEISIDIHDDVVGDMNTASGETITLMCNRKTISRFFDDVYDRKSKMKCEYSILRNELGVINTNTDKKTPSVENCRINTNYRNLYYYTVRKGYGCNVQFTRSAEKMLVEVISTMNMEELWQLPLLGVVDTIDLQSAKATCGPILDTLIKNADSLEVSVAATLTFGKIKTAIDKLTTVHQSQINRAIDSTLVPRLSARGRYKQSSTQRQVWEMLNLQDTLIKTFGIHDGILKQNPTIDTRIDVEEFILEIQDLSHHGFFLYFNTALRLMGLIAIEQRTAHKLRTQIIERQKANPFPVALDIDRVISTNPDLKNAMLEVLKNDSSALGLKFSADRSDVLVTNEVTASFVPNDQVDVTLDWDNLNIVWPNDMPLEQKMDDYPKFTAIRRITFGTSARRLLQSLNQVIADKKYSLSRLDGHITKPEVTPSQPATDKQYNSIYDWAYDRITVEATTRMLDALVDIMYGKTLDIRDEIDVMYTMSLEKSVMSDVHVLEVMRSGNVIHLDGFFIINKAMIVYIGKLSPTAQFGNLLTAKLTGIVTTEPYDYESEKNAILNSLFSHAAMMDEQLSMKIFSEETAMTTLIVMAPVCNVLAQVSQSLSNVLLLQLATSVAGIVFEHDTTSAMVLASVTTERLNQKIKLLLSGNLLPHENEACMTEFFDSYPREAAMAHQLIKTKPQLCPLYEKNLERLFRTNMLSKRAYMELSKTVNLSKDEEGPIFPQVELQVKKQQYPKIRNIKLAVNKYINTTISMRDIEIVMDNTSKPIFRLKKPNRMELTANQAIKTLNYLLIGVMQPDHKKVEDRLRNLINAHCVSGDATESTLDVKRWLRDSVKDSVRNNLSQNHIQVFNSVSDDKPSYSCTIILLTQEKLGEFIKLVAMDSKRSYNNSSSKTPHFKHVFAYNLYVSDQILNLLQSRGELSSMVEKMLQYQGLEGYACCRQTRLIRALRYAGKNTIQPSPFPSRVAAELKLLSKQQKYKHEVRHVTKNDKKGKEKRMMAIKANSVYEELANIFNINLEGKVMNVRRREIFAIIVQGLIILCTLTILFGISKISMAIPLLYVIVRCGLKIYNNV